MPYQIPAQLRCMCGRERKGEEGGGEGRISCGEGMKGGGVGRKGKLKGKGGGYIADKE